MYWSLSTYHSRVYSHDYKNVPSQDYLEGKFKRILIFQSQEFKKPCQYCFIEENSLNFQDHFLTKVFTLFCPLSGILGLVLNSCLKKCKYYVNF